jgi:hypothetical protein
MVHGGINVSMIFFYHILGKDNNNLSSKQKQKQEQNKQNSKQLPPTL